MSILDVGEEISMGAAKLLERGIGNKFAVVGAGVALGAGSALFSKKGMFRQQIYPAVSQQVAGDPNFVGMVARARWNQQWKTPGQTFNEPRVGGFDPGGNIVLGMYNLRNSGNR